MSAAHLVACAAGEALEIAAVLQVATHPLWLNGQLVHGPDTHQFQHVPAHGVLLMQAQGTVWVAAQTPKALALIRPNVQQQSINP